MSYVVEQKIKGRIYLYEVTSYWDKEKQQARQKRKYIGPKERLNNTKKGSVKDKPTKLNSSNFSQKTVGDIFLVQSLFQNLGLEKIIKDTLPDDYMSLINLATYFISSSSASYLYPYWHNEHFFKKSKNLNSASISSLYEDVGRREQERLDILKSWAKSIAPESGIYYDITSVSSYSENIEGVDWGYNRDKESLPQINIGITHCRKTSLPISYNIYPGSIVDVTTLKNTINVLNLFELKNLFLILDRGFCSKSNIMQMYNDSISFIQPMPLHLKICKDLLSKQRDSICMPQNMFMFKEEVLHHKNDKITMDGVDFNAHIFFNEKAAINFKHHIYSSIFKAEDSLDFKIKFNNAEELNQYAEEQIISKLRKYFKVDESSMSIKRDYDAINNEIFKAGAFVMIVNGETQDKMQIIEAYRNRDEVEKDMHSLKNELDGKRIRAHNSHTANGRIFVKFLAMIIRAKIINVIKKHEKLKNYSVNEIFAELRKLKVNCFDEDNNFITEITKKQKTIFEAFSISDKVILEHGY